MVFYSYCIQTFWFTLLISVFSRQPSIENKKKSTVDNSFDMDIWMMLMDVIKFIYIIPIRTFIMFIYLFILYTIYVLCYSSKIILKIREYILYFILLFSLCLIKY
jgi:hypothetical protein